MKNIKISVIIPAYNSEEFITLCLNSIMSQTYKNIEIIVVDDCSKDNTVKIVKKLSKRIKVFSTKRNSKQGKARNIGIQNSTGDYLLFVDADDYISNDKIIEKIVNKINKSNLPDIVYLGMQVVGKRNMKIIPDKENTKKEFRLAENPYINAVSICWKRELIIKNKIRFPERIKYEDVYFSFLGIEKSNTYTYLKDIYYIYNNRENSTTTDYSLSQAKDTILLIEKLFELYSIIEKQNRKYLEKRIKQQYERAKVRLDRAIESEIKKRAN